MDSDQCINQFIEQAERLRIEIYWNQAENAQLDASYHALPGEPGVIYLYKQKHQVNRKELCTLLAHEMVHVMQHWKGNLEATPPLGWPTNSIPKGRKLSIQEMEAYSAQTNPKKVLKGIKALKTKPD